MERPSIFAEDHVKAIEDEPKYVKERYQAVARTLTPKPFRIPRETATGMLKRSVRQLYRILRRFLDEGLPGLRHRSRIPRTPPKRIPDDVVAMILAVREACSLGPNHVSTIVNESFERGEDPEGLSPLGVQHPGT